MKRIAFTSTVLLVSLITVGLTAQQQPAARPPDNPRLEQLKKEAIADIDTHREFTQHMIDQVFSFGELRFQEFETSK
jgi:aminobenzoyl-glutamate utilization protein B